MSAEEPRKSPIRGLAAVAILGIAGAFFWIYGREAPVPEQIAAPAPQEQPSEVVAQPEESAAATPESTDAAQDDSAATTPESTEAAQDESVAAVPETADAPQEDNIATAEAPEADAPEDNIVPRLDELRIEEDGLAVIAGSAMPFSRVSLRADGDEIAQATTDGAGKFATVALLSPSKAARILTMTVTGPDGSETLSPDELILAPVSAPEAPEDTTLAEAVETPAGDGAANDTSAAQDAAEVAAADTQAQSADAATPLVEETPEPTAGNAADETAQVAANTEAADTPQDSVSAAPAADENLPSDGAEIAPDRALALLETAEDAPANSAAGGSIETQPAVPAEVSRPAPDPERPVSGDTAAVEPATADPIQPEVETAQIQTPQTATEPETGQQVAVIRSNEEGVKVINPAAPSPDITSQIALDTISYSDLGDVELTGRAQQAAEEVRVYLNNVPITSLPIADDGNWQGALPNVDTGVYNLRIDEVNEAGKVISRVETPFKREDPVVLAAAQTSAPVSAITVQKGATLWAIARDRYGEGFQYVQIFEANRDTISDPDLIFPGQVFKLPGE